MYLYIYIFIAGLKIMGFSHGLALDSPSTLPTSLWESACPYIYSYIHLCTFLGKKTFPSQPSPFQDQQRNFSVYIYIYFYRFVFEKWCTSFLVAEIQHCVFLLLYLLSISAFTCHLRFVRTVGGWNTGGDNPQVIAPAGCVHWFLDKVVVESTEYMAFK